MREHRESFQGQPGRRARSLAGIVLFALLEACAPAQPMLNSERIEERFGSFGIEVAATAAGVRRANLYSVHENGPVCRTFAIVRFQPRPTGAENAALLSAERAIDSGASLGATLRRAGWQVEKRTRYVGTLPALEPPPDWVDWMQIDGTQGLAVHVYELYIRKGQQVFEFARITEVHHPDYLTREAVASLYPVAADETLDESTIAAAVAELAAGT